MIIEFSGIDGSGKTTQIHKLMRWVNDSGIPCYERILRSTNRRVLAGIAVEKGLRSWHELFDPNAVELSTALEMLQLVHSTILPANFTGQFFITDTYIRSWLADAMTNTSSVEHFVLIYQQLPAPDLSIHLDISVEIAYQRILARIKGDHKLRFGGIEKLNFLSQAFQTVSQYVDYPSYTISTSRTEEETFKEIKQVILEHFLSSNPKLYSLLS